MRLSLILLPFLISLAYAQQTQFVRCQFFLGEVYRCQIAEANVTTETLPVDVIEGPHFGGNDRTNVTLLLGTSWGVQLQVITRDLINFFPNLNTVNIMASNVQRIAANAFENCANIREIMLTSNELAITAMNGVFRNCGNLTLLQLSNNGFNRVQRGIFTGLTNLENLSLANNRLTTLPNDLFTDLRNLRILNLSGNEIQEYSPTVFAPLTLLETFSSSFGWLRSINPTTFSTMVNLRNLNLEGNNLNHLPDAVFQNLVNIEGISIEMNGIRVLESTSFSAHPNLTRFLIRSNGLHSIDPRFFTVSAPNLWEFDGMWNNCIDERVFNASDIDFNGETIFDRCFYNWENRSGSEKVGGTFMVILASFVGLMKFF